MNEFLEMFGQYEECEFSYRGHNYFFSYDTQYNLADMEPKFKILHTFETFDEMMDFPFFDGKSFREVFDSDIQIIWYG